MRILSRDELRSLMDTRDDPSVSIYMPAHPINESEQDPILLKNLFRQAEEQLGAYGMRATDAHSLLEPAARLLPDMGFWQHQGNGLAVFISPGFFRYYRTPYSFYSLVIVSQRFHLKPLIPLFSDDGMFYILAISQGQVRLLQCTRYFVRDVTPEHIPASKEVALQFDEPLKQFQYHTTGPGGMTVSHGQGVSKDEDKVNILRYFQQVNEGLQEILHDEHARQIWGTFDTQTRKVKLFEREQFGLEDLLDLAAMYTLNGGGRVFAVTTEEIPQNKELAALYRY